MGDRYGFFVTDTTETTEVVAGGFMNYMNNVETMLEESTALFDGYLERIFESESMNDIMGASHWYADAFYCLMTQPQR